MNTKLHFSSVSDDWATPQWLFDALNKNFKFTLDPCATKENAKCKKFFTKETNGLDQDWSKDRAFVNPPYGRVLKHWVEKAAKTYDNCGFVVLLVPSRTDTSWWHKWIVPYARIIYLNGRLSFVTNGVVQKGSHAAPFPSALAIYDGPHRAMLKTIRARGKETETE